MRSIGSLLVALVVLQALPAAADQKAVLQRKGAQGPVKQAFGHEWTTDFAPYYTQRQIQAKVRKMGRQITKDYRGKDLLLVGVLNGAAPLASDLARRIEIPLQLDFVRVKSYDGQKSSGTANLIGTLPENLAGRSVLIVDEIVETGLTTKFLTDELYRRGAADVKIATLIHKPEQAKHDQPVHYLGFTIRGSNPYLVGYGLDDGRGNFRNLPDIRVKREVP